MIIRAALAAGVFGLLATAVVGEAQQARKVWTIGVLWTSSPALVSSAQAALRRGLHEAGYVEGKNIQVENRYAEEKPERLPALAAELVQLRADVIVTQGTLATKAVKNATDMIPIVMTLVADPIGAGFIKSLGRPGGNLTGPTTVAKELNAKRLELLKEAIPGLARVAVLGTRTPPLHRMIPTAGR